MFYNHKFTRYIKENTLLNLSLITTDQDLSYNWKEVQVINIKNKCRDEYGVYIICDINYDGQLKEDIYIHESNYSMELTLGSWKYANDDLNNTLYYFSEIEDKIHNKFCDYVMLALACTMALNSILFVIIIK